MNSLGATIGKRYPSPYKDAGVTAIANKYNVSREDQQLITKLVQQFTDRSRKDIDKWREAIRLNEDIERPRRDKLMEIYTDIELDAHLSSQMQIRKFSVLSKKFKVIDRETGKEDVDRTRLLQTPWFYKFCSEALDTRFYGTTLFEFGDIVEGEFKEGHIIDRRHVVPEQSIILLNRWDWTGIRYNSDEFTPWIIELGEKSDRGLLMKAAPYVIWKKNAQQAWAQFLEMFGMPYRTATTNSRDTKQIARIEMLLDQMGQAAYGVFPEGTTIDFKHASQGDAYNVFDKNIERQNSEISKLINSVTMLSDNGSSRAQGEVHLQVHDALIEADMTFLQFLINWDLFWLLNKHGYGLEGFEFQFDRTEQIKLQDLWKMVNEALQHFDLDEAWLTEKFGFPIKAKKSNVTGPGPLKGPTAKLDNINIKFDKLLPANVMADIIKQVTDSDIESESTDETKLDRQSLQEKAIAMINEIIKQFGLQSKANENFQQGLPVSSSTGPVVNAALDKKLNKLFAGAMESVFKNRSSKVSELKKPEWNKIYKYIVGKLFRGVEDGYGEQLPDLDYDTPDYLLLKSMQDNIYVFSAYKNFQLLADLNHLLLDEEGKLREWQDFKAEALKINEAYNKTWLEAEYDNAVASAQEAANWQRDYELRDQFYGRYDDAGDDRVRPEHQALDGIIKALDDSWWDTYNPPNGWRCRCTRTLVPKAGNKETDTSKIAMPAIKPLFKNNVGKTGMIFPETHEYYKVAADDKKEIVKFVNEEIKKLKK
jgi:SPP1 gp7 family putative phage head morphogenesis protein